MYNIGKIANLRSYKIIHPFDKALVKWWGLSESDIY
jgi:hypothetical protein